MLDPSLVVLAAAVGAACKDIIGHSEGPLGLSGFKSTVAWRDERGFHRFYASGYSTDELARAAAIDGAKKLGYVEPLWWEFWKARLLFHA